MRDQITFSYFYNKNKNKEMNNNNNDNKLFIGLDLHKNTSTFCVKDKEGKLIVLKKVLTDRNDISRFINSIKQIGNNLSLVLEPVSQWYYYADLIESLGVEVHLAHPLRVKAISAGKCKTDKIDAGILCDLLRANLLPKAYFSPKEVRGWKEMCRFRASLLNLRRQVKNKIHAILHKQALKHNFSNLFGKSGRQWLCNLSLPEPYQSNLEKYLLTVNWFDDLIAETEKSIRQTVKTHSQANLLVSVPGISYVSALTIIAEIGDINRFPNAKHLQGYAGLVPRVKDSGDKQIRGRITKQGSKWLRYIMIETAHHQVNCKKIPGFGSYYRALQKRKGSKTAAVATARKLLAVVWRLLKDNRPYQVVAPRCRKSGALASNLSSF